MITRLDIANYAIIESVSVDFSSNLNIITGETGSGKSILLGALNLILGERADTKVLYNRDKKCIVEGTFQVDRYDLRSFFERNDLDYDNEVVIRREIAASGKSRAFINDTPVKLKQVRDLCSRLVDLHQQFENFGINDQGYQLGMIDAVARVQELKASYQEHFRRWKSWLTTADELRLKQRSALQEKDFIQFQLTEFEDCDLDEKKDSGLEERMQEMEHAEEIISGLAQISRRLEEEDTNVVGQLKDLLQSISQITKHHGGAASLFSRLDSVIIELQDIAI
ncbi:MAG: AAA family ATPase, partial [Saprospiraceae bacterium]|nr:AAA family ATPase [Saprospiraceae bacterium]